MNPFTFVNRSEAGRALAGELRRYANHPEVLVLALPRGGVPVGFEIALSLHVPLDLFLVRKLGVPQNEELAMGAIASGHTRVLNRQIIERMQVSDGQLEETLHRETAELERREAAFRPGRPPVAIAGHVCILVDDGLATGSTMRAAVMALKKQVPRRMVVAVPVAAADTCSEMEPLVDEMVCLYRPEPFLSVGRWYDDFAQLNDDQVRAYMDRAAHEMAH